jgi:TolB-like protein
MYVGGAWVIFKGAEMLLPRIGLPDWTITALLLVMVIGFPLALALSWMFDLTSEGVKRTRRLTDRERSALPTGRYLDFIVIGLLVAVVIYLLVDRLTLTERVGVAVDSPSIAVLAFDNMSDDPSNEYFSEGISEQILNELVKQSDLKVIARTSSFQFKGENRDIREIGRILNVTHVLEGSVRKANNRVRITAQLIETVEGSHLWSETYDRELKDIFLLQDEIAEMIIDALRARLIETDSEAQQIDPNAFDHYLLGNYHTNRSAIDAAIAQYRKAVAIDPAFADAFGALSRAHHLRIFYELRPVAEELLFVQMNVDQALSLDPEQPEALSVRATKRFFVDRDYQGALDEFHRHVARFPSNIALLSNYRNPLTTMGRTDLAIQLAERIVELDPLSPFSYLQYALQLEDSGRFAEAIEAFRTMRTLAPSSFPDEGSSLFGRSDDPNERAWWLADLERIVGDAPSRYHRTAALYFFTTGEMERAREHADKAMETGKGFMSGRVESNLLWVMGEIDGSTARMRRSLAEREYRALVNLRWLRTLARRSTPADATIIDELLADVGLDEASASELVVQPFPF